MFSQWEDFLAQARQAGAGDNAVVEEVSADGTTDVLCGSRVQLTERD